MRIIKEEAYQKARSLIERHIYQDMDASQIVPEAKLEDLGIDSLDKADLILALENEIDGNINDHEAAGLKTVGDVAALLEKALA